MTRKDFVTIANVLKATKPDVTPDKPAAHQAWMRVATQMRDALKSTNERFDGPRFMLACGVELNQ